VLRQRMFEVNRDAFEKSELAGVNQAGSGRLDDRGEHGMCPFSMSAMVIGCIRCAS
jgi:hypothetical protein